MNISLSDLRSLLNSNPDLELNDTYIFRPVTPPEMAVPVGKMSEADMQMAVIRECNARAITDPRYSLLLAIPNGQYRKGQRMEPGLKAGLPDLMLPIMNHGYGALFLELKISPNKPSQSQGEWISRLQAQGYFCKVIWDSVDEALAVLEWYIEGA